MVYVVFIRELVGLVGVANYFFGSGECCEDLIETGGCGKRF